MLRVFRKSGPSLFRDGCGVDVMLFALSQGMTFRSPFNSIIRQDTFRCNCWFLLPMVNRSNAVVYYVFFALHKKTGEKIVAEIFEKHAKTGGF